MVFIYGGMDWTAEPPADSYAHLVTPTDRCPVFIPGGPAGGSMCHSCKQSEASHKTRLVETYTPGGPFLAGIPGVVSR